MIRVGILGCGRWGPNHVRIFSLQSDACVSLACDPSAERRAALSARFPSVETVADPEQVFTSSEVDAVVVATPVESHFDLVRRAIEAGKDVLCEKPLCLHPDEGEELCRRADAAGVLLMVGHVYLFEAGVLALRRYVERNELGALQYAFSTRLNRGPVRSDVSVVYDLASHDVAIFNYLFDAKPESVGVEGLSITRPDADDVVFLTLRYPNNLLVQVHASWVAARKVRQITLVGEEKSAEWDELAALGPMRLIEPAPADQMLYKNFGELQQMVRETGVLMPRIGSGEPLESQARHFLECVRTRKAPMADGRRATAVVDTLWQAQQILNCRRNSGCPDGARRATRGRD